MSARKLEHGEYTTYVNRGCRCAECREANAIHKQILRERARFAAETVCAPRKPAPHTGVFAVCTVPTAHLRGWR